MLKITVDDTALQKALAKAKIKLGNTKPLMAGIANLMLEAVEESFDKETDPKTGRSGGKSINCRIGSLEIAGTLSPQKTAINCRIGSLENHDPYPSDSSHINCRIGSLETNCAYFRWHDSINCRIGSLEKQ